jgi:hypothetical protein
MPAPTDAGPADGLRVAPTLLIRMVCDGALISDGASGTLDAVCEVLRLDARSAEVLELFTRRASVSDVVGEVVRRYPASPAERVAADIADLVAALVDRGVLLPLEGASRQ